MNYHNPYAPQQQYAAQNQQFNLTPYTQWIEHVVYEEANILVTNAPVPPPLKAKIFDLIMSEGYQLILSMLQDIFNKHNWDDETARNIIDTCISFIIARELLPYNIIVNEFRDSVLYVNDWLKAREPQLRNVDAFGGYKQQFYQPQPTAVVAPPPNYGVITAAKAGVIENSPFNILQNNTNMNKNQHIPDTNTFDFNNINKQQPDGVQITTVTNKPTRPVVIEAEAITDFIKLKLADKRKKLADLVTDNITPGSEVYQLSTIAYELSIIKDITLYNKYTEKYIAMIDKDDGTILKTLKGLVKLDSVTDIIEQINTIKDDNVISWLSNRISNHALIALKYRYDINVIDGFPILQQYHICKSFLEDRGIRGDMEKVIVNFVNNLCTDIMTIVTPVVTVTPNIDKVIIEVVIKEPILIIPHLCTCGFIKNNLRCILPDGIGDNSLTINHIFQQAFEKLDSTTIYIDVYDAALSVFRVYRLGRNSSVPNNYTVVYQNN